MPEIYIPGQVNSQLHAQYKHLNFRIGLLAKFSAVADKLFQILTNFNDAVSKKYFLTSTQHYCDVQRTYPT